MPNTIHNDDAEIKVCVSVLNWNNWKQTINCISSVLLSDYPHFEIAIVDNASIDDSVVRIRAAYPTMALICAHENLGYAAGNRLALDYAQKQDADLFWILNNDCTVEHDTLSLLVESFRQHGAALYGSTPLLTAGDVTRPGLKSYGLNRNGQPDLTNVLPWNKMTLEQYQSVVKEQRVANLNGASLLIPLAIIKTYGFLNERFFMYWEDIEYCLRMAREGIPSIIVPRSFVHHSKIGSYRENPGIGAILSNYYSTRNKLVVLRGYVGTKHYLAIASNELKRLFYKVSQWAKQCIINRRLMPPPLSTRLYAAGISDGLLGRLGKVYRPEDFL